ncbi:hypothetical protein [Sphaerimonospora thailandensis]|uniref:Uncharacterized protein n=1 Tax=Sphaerimonospora thailandensis TaxID=795644 RepID=A0A8J3R9F5_9ACTN|nr:hypothetical protein [Sphaerimonospora thailandensis]GIH70350.1 hypothetical protein Mth01_26030 [Sphaerimonospora thailandensis]
MPRFDPDSGITYGEYLRRKGIQVKGDRSVPRRRETRDQDGRLVREVAEMTDSGAVSIVRNRTSARGEHQDVHMHMPTLRGGAGVLTPGVQTR